MSAEENKKAFDMVDWMLRRFFKYCDQEDVDKIEAEPRTLKKIDLLSDGIERYVQRLKRIIEKQSRV